MLQTVQHLISQLSAEQWAFVAGFLMFVGHCVLDRNKQLSSDVNKWIARFATTVLPVITALAVDPTVQGFIHNYMPALASFLATYQGLYLFGTAAYKKALEIWAQLKAANIVVQGGFEQG